MSFGLTVDNSSGEVVIDETYRNHAIEAEGTVSIPRLGASYPYPATVTVTLGAPIAMSRGPLIWGAVQGTAGGVALVSIEVDGSGNLTKFVLGTDLSFGGGSYTCDWKVTALPAAASSDTHGLRVYDDTGAVAYDSGHRYLRMQAVSGVLTLAGSPAYETLTFNHASLGARFFCLSGLHAIGVDNPSDDYYLIALGARRNSDSQSYVYWVNHAYLAGETLLWGNAAQSGPRRLVIGTE